MAQSQTVSNLKSKPQGVPDRGVDKPTDRPGVPMEVKPRKVGHPPAITPQRADARVLKRMELDKLTPVFGTAQPPRGISGALRALAYDVPEHKARRWMLLLLADRVDVFEARLVRVARYLPIALPAIGLGYLGLRELRRRGAF